MVLGTQAGTSLTENLPEKEKSGPLAFLGDDRTDEELIEDAREKSKRRRQDSKSGSNSDKERNMDPGQYTDDRTKSDQGTANPFRDKVPEVGLNRAAPDYRRYADGEVPGEAPFSINPNNPNLPEDHPVGAAYAPESGLDVEEQFNSPGEDTTHDEEDSKGAGNDGGTTNVTVQYPDSWDREQTEADTEWEAAGMTREQWIAMQDEFTPSPGPTPGPTTGPTGPTPPPTPEPRPEDERNEPSGGSNLANVAIAGGGVIGVVALAYVMGWI